MRTKGILKDILHVMRSGEILDAAWRALQSRVLGQREPAEGTFISVPHGVPDPRLSRPPCPENVVTYIVHRHNLRVCQSNCNALRNSIRGRVPLYMSIAADEFKTRDGHESVALAELRVDMLKENNLRKLHYLWTSLPLHLRAAIYCTIKHVCAYIS